jgi:hypothetical protein
MLTTLSFFCLLGLAAAQIAIVNGTEDWNVEIPQYKSRVDFSSGCAALVTEEISISCLACSQTNATTIVLMLYRSKTFSKFSRSRIFNISGDASGSLTYVSDSSLLTPAAVEQRNITFVWQPSLAQTVRTATIVTIVEDIIEGSRTNLQDMSRIRWSVFGEALKNVTLVDSAWSIPFHSDQGYNLGNWAVNTISAGASLASCNDCYVAVQDPGTDGGRARLLASYNMRSGPFPGAGMQIDWKVTPEPDDWLCEVQQTIIGAGVAGGIPAVIGTMATAIVLFVIALIYASFVWSAWFAKKVKSTVDRAKDALNRE